METYSGTIEAGWLLRRRIPAAFQGLADRTGVEVDYFDNRGGGVFAYKVYGTTDEIDDFISRMRELMRDW